MDTLNVYSVVTTGTTRALYPAACTRAKQIAVDAPANARPCGRRGCLCALPSHFGLRLEEGPDAKVCRENFLAMHGMEPEPLPGEYVWVGGNGKHTPASRIRDKALIGILRWMEANAQRISRMRSTGEDWRENLHEGYAPLSAEATRRGLKWDV